MASKTLKIADICLEKCLFIHSPPICALRWFSDFLFINIDVPYIVVWLLKKCCCPSNTKLYA